MSHCVPRTGMRSSIAEAIFMNELVFYVMLPPSSQEFHETFAGIKYKIMKVVKSNNIYRF